jgi:hypothetical protein
MTVIATLLAGMSNSELSAAQYERSAAAQYQSKAADQWNFFQVKKIRGASLDNTLDLVQGLTQAGTLDVEALRTGAEKWPARFSKALDDFRAIVQPLDLPTEKKASLDASLKTLTASSAEVSRLSGQVTAILNGPAKDAIAAAGAGPSFTAKPIASRDVKAAVEAISANKSDSELAPLLAKVDERTWDEALRTAEGNAADLDSVTGPASKVFDSLRAALDQLMAVTRSSARTAREMGDQTQGFPTGSRTAFSETAGRLIGVGNDVQALAADLAATRLRYGARRYAMEAPLNQELALLTEVRVHQSNMEAEHHRQRSRLFFYGVLIAQAAVVGTTLALAMRHKNFLWILAALAGLAALTFGIYVRVYV